MRRKMTFRTNGQYDPERIYETVRSCWPEALWADHETPGYCEDRVYKPGSRNFFIHQTASSLIDVDREDVPENGTIEFILEDDRAVIRAMPRIDTTIESLVHNFVVQGWEPIPVGAI